MFIANARMYSVAPGVGEAWRAFFAWLSEASGVELTTIDHAYPAPLAALWARADLGCAFMCGYPFIKGQPRPHLLAAPIPADDRASGRAVYATDFVVRADSDFATLPDTFGGRLGFTVDSSHSGFNAVRYHLLQYRSPTRPRLYHESVGPLHTPRRVVDALLAGQIDVGPLDGYALDLMRRHDPAFVRGVRVIESTAHAPAPPLVAGSHCPDDVVARLRAALTACDKAQFGNALCLAGFAPAQAADYELLLRWEREAEAAGYPAPG